MIASIKPVSSSLTAIAGVKLRFSPLPIIRNYQKPNPFSQVRVMSTQNLSSFPVAAVPRRDVIRVGAYEAEWSRPIKIGIEAPDEQSELGEINWFRA